MDGSFRIVETACDLGPTGRARLIALRRSRHAMGGVEAVELLFEEVSVACFSVEACQQQR